jgi:predicted site-specific integrase-resolvase
MKQNVRKFNSDFRKKLVNKIQIINNSSIYNALYYIIIDDIGDNISSNRNGIFVDLNLLSDNCIEKINIFLNSKIKKDNILIAS